MVSNYDRIYREIERYAKVIERKHGVNANELTSLVMEIVDLEDRNRIKPIAINIQIGDLVDQSAKTHARRI